MATGDPERPVSGGLTRLRAALAGPRGYRKVDALLSAADPAAAVAALGVSELYALIKEVGLHDTVELVQLATPKQLRGCLDVDVWDKDQVQLEALRPWLTTLVECGYEKVGAVWAAIDTELAALILARSCYIYDLIGGEEPDDDDGKLVMLTPDSCFALKLLDERDDDGALIQRVIEDLYRYDTGGAMARKTILSARSEPPASLEESSYRWRTGRMADLGYVDFYEALEIFRPLDVESVKVGEGSEDRFERAEADSGAGDEGPGDGLLPAVAEGVIGASFLARALDRIDDDGEARRLEVAAMVLSNKVLSAARVKPGESEALRIGAEHAMATVSLGLETVSKGDLDRAARALETISFTRLHRVGHTITLRLARMAHVIAPRAATAAAPVGELVAALCGRRPFYARALDGGVGVRAFESTDDVRKAAAALARLALQIAIADGLGVDLLAAAHLPEPRPALDDHVRTALVRAMIGGELSPAPLTQRELTAFRAEAMTGGELGEDARRRAAAAVLGLLDGAQIKAGREHLSSLVFDWLTDIESALGPLAAGDVDPRYVSGLVVAAGRV